MDIQTPAREVAKYLSADPLFALGLLNLDDDAFLRIALRAKQILEARAVKAGYTLRLTA